jgi:hypothetical protein
VDDEIDRLLRDHAERWRDAQPDVRAATTNAVGRAASPIPTWRRRTGLVLVATGCVALIAAALALTLRHDDTAHSTRVATSPSTTDAARPVTPVTVPLPNGVHLAADVSAVFEFPAFTNVNVLAVDARAPGVWAWGAGGKPTKAGTFAADSRIWHYDPTTGTTKSWSIGTSGDVLGGVAYPALAACASGVWFGSNHLLLRLDPSTGAQRRYTVSSGAASAATDADRPDNGMSGVTALACDAHDGTVLVGLSDSTTAFRFHPSDGTFDPIALPADGVVTMMATATDGDVAIGLQSTRGAGPNRVMVVPHDGKPSRIVAVQNSLTVTAVGDRILVGVGAQVIEPGATNASDPLIPDSVAGKLDPTTTAPWPLPDGRLVLRGNDPGPALIVLDPSTRGGTVSTLPVALGTQRCGRANIIDHFGPSEELGGPNVTTTTIDPDAPCPITLNGGPWMNTYVVDRSGDLYGFAQLRDPEDHRATSFHESLVRIHLP